MKKHEHDKDFKYGVQYSAPDPHVRYFWIKTPPGPPLKWYQIIDWWFWLIVLHGGVKENPHHAFTHMHKVNADAINAGNRVEMDIEITDAYSTFEQAIQYFVQQINLDKIQRIEHFPSIDGEQGTFNFGT